VNDKALLQLGVLKGPVFWPAIRVIVLVRMFHFPLGVSACDVLFVCLFIFLGHPKAFCTTICIEFRVFLFL